MMVTIKAMRIDRNMTQEEFARRVGVSKKTAHHWETGKTKPCPDKIESICNVLNCKYDDIRFNI